MEALLQEGLGRAVPGDGLAYVRGVLAAMQAPLPKVLVSAWRACDRFLEFSPHQGRPASSGTIELVDHEIRGYWELAGRFPRSNIEGPRLRVSVELKLDAAIVKIREGRFVGLSAAAMAYRGDVRLKGAPEPIAEFASDRWEIPGGKIDFGKGWPIRPEFAAWTAHGDARPANNTAAAQ